MLRVLYLHGLPTRPRTLGWRESTQGRKGERTRRRAIVQPKSLMNYCKRSVTTALQPVFPETCLWLIPPYRINLALQQRPDHDILLPFACTRSPPTTSSQAATTCISPRNVRISPGVAEELEADEEAPGASPLRGTPPRPALHARPPAETPNAKPLGAQQPPLMNNLGGGSGLFRTAPRTEETKSRTFIAPVL